MPTTFKGKRYETVFVTESNTTFVLDKKAVIYGGGEIVNGDTPDGDGIIEDLVNSPGIGGNTYKINGRIIGLSSGITTYGEDTTIAIGKGAEVTGAVGFGATGGLTAVAALSAMGENSKITIGLGAGVNGTIGILLGGSHSAATNNGDIGRSFLGMSAGDFLSGGATPLEDIKLVNNGYIEAFIGMASAGVDGAVIENGKKGEIIGFAAGISSYSQPDTQVTINNSGTVRILISSDELPEDLFGAPAAIVGAEGEETVRNTGKIFGNVMLGDGDDRFDNTGGSVKGLILGGVGDDTLTVDKASTRLTELYAEGIDRVRSSVSYVLNDNVEGLVLIGAKNTTATGNDGINVLLGNKGNNILTGLGEVDVFAFQTGGGKDTIADFGDGADVINLSRWKAIDDYDAVEAHATDHKGDLWIKAGKDILIIADYTVNDLDSGHFSWLA